MPDEHPCIYVETQEQLQDAVKELQKATQLAIDLECENNLHHYGMYLSLVQVATHHKQYVFDIITLKTLGGLKDILESSAISKVFHDVSFDLRILSYEFNCSPKNVFDTKLASTFLRKEEVGLGGLLQEFFGIKKQKKFQMADWSARPLKPGMLAYAADDTTYLLELHDKLCAELKEAGYYKWYVEECAEIERREWKHKLPIFEDLKGFKKLPNPQKAVVEALFNLREQFAKQVDKPPHFILANKKMLEIAAKPPVSPGMWKKMSGVHPIVKRQAEKCFMVVKKALSSNKKYTFEKPKRYGLVERNHFAKLNRAREAVAKKTKLLPHVILSKEQMQSIVIEKNRDCLRPWQEKLLESYL